jgi:hypothetical protein
MKTLVQTLLPPKEEKKRSWAPVAHACNSSYSGGRDQEDHSLKPAQGNSSRDPTLGKKNHKKSWWSDFKV